jgi:hypothetical protein
MHGPGILFMLLSTLLALRQARAPSRKLAAGIVSVSKWGGHSYFGIVVSPTWSASSVFFLG